MKKYEIDQKHSLYDLVNIIKSATDTDLILYFKKSASIYKNSSNLKILLKIAEENQKEIKFQVENQKHRDYVDAVSGDFAGYDESQVDLDAGATVKAEVYKKGKPKGPSFVGKAGSIFKPKSKEGKEGVKRSFPFKVIIGMILTISLILGGLFALWWYIPSATVKINVDSEVLVKLLNIKAVVGQNDISVENSTIPAFRVEVTETDSQTNPTTGEKEVGEKAEGEITVYNKTDEDVMLKKGTTVKLIVTEEESLKYETMEDVKVPAQTEEVDGITYGKAKVKIKAKTFGDQYNKDRGQNFEINDYDTDELVGENEGDITGGSLEKISVVAQGDINALKRSLEEFLKGKVSSSLQKKTVGGQKLLESSIQYTVLSSEFNKQVDDEANEITLTMSVRGTGLAYSESDLDKIVKELIQQVIPDEYRLDESEPEYEVAVLGVEDNAKSLGLQVKLRSFITPKLDEDKIRGDLTGMRMDQAQEYLNELKNIKGYEIMMSPDLPGFLRAMPHKVNNIAVEVNK